MKKLGEFTNLFLTIFLVISLTVNMLQGRMTYYFIKDFREGRKQGIKDRKEIMRMDSLELKQMTIIFQEQIQGHENSARTQELLRELLNKKK